MNLQTREQKEPQGKKKVNGNPKQQRLYEEKEERKEVDSLM